MKRNSNHKLGVFKIIMGSLLGAFLVPLQAQSAFATAPTWSDNGTATFNVAENIDETTFVILLSDSTTATASGGATIATYTLAGTDASAFDIPVNTVDEIKFVASPDFETKSSYSFDVIVEDSNNETSSATVNINITNVGPVWTPNTDSFAVNENIDTLTTTVDIDTTTVTGAPTFSLPGLGSSDFTIDANTGVMNFVNAPDYESVSSYTAAVVATESGESSTLTVTISILNVTSDDPAPAPAPAPVYIPTTPQTALVLTSSATSVAWGSSVKLTLAGGSGTGSVTFSSTGTTFCAVNPSGNLTPVSAGTCTVTANKDGDGTYGSAQSNSITITATENAVASTSSTSNSGVAMVVGKPVGGVATVKFTVADTYAGEKVSVILATKSSSGKTLYKTLGSAKVGTTGAVSFKTKVKLPVGAVLQLKSAGTVILSKSIK